MAKNGFRVFDSDMHIMEPPDLWERYIAPEFRPIAPRGLTSDNVRDLRIMFPGGEPNARNTSGVPNRGHNYERNQNLYETMLGGGGGQTASSRPWTSRESTSRSSFLRAG